MVYTKSQHVCPSLICTHFKSNFELGTRCCYLDLDTVILGPLGGILRGFSQPLGLLSTDTMANEGRKGGYNSSIIIWTAGTFEEVYTKLIYR